ncbi:DUF4912 domain-containing protein [Niallia sp. NCCP-28]|uniref:DUF4912 domain-containing protein n=1 Tax=Niallia sp. NCCP-28 TaxID=2934712 RepID=UPI00208177C7|nr:DUF4912 domain-containing protein [Niallia sp. NCCP-28]GKU81263.1 hypothetical protein NCCP28_06590 [Niallia sp. NCCP-28]
MLEQILELRRKGLSFRKIAKELESTVGKVQYQWNKYMKSLQEEEKNAVDTEVKSRQSKANDKSEIASSEQLMKTSIQELLGNNGMEARVSAETGAFVFWRIPQGKWSILLQYYGIKQDQCAFILKVNDITSIIYNGKNAHSTKQIELQNGIEHAVIEDLQANRSYCFEVGVLDHYQAFIPILQSNPIQLPRTNKNHTGALARDMETWVKGNSAAPNWIEHVSTYSYYETEREDVKKK